MIIVDPYLLAGECLVGVLLLPVTMPRGYVIGVVDTVPSENEKAQLR